MTTVFTSTVHWCKLSEPDTQFKLSDPIRPTYGLTFDATTAPEEIRPYLMLKSEGDRILGTVRQPFAPVISFAETGDYAPLMQLRDMAAIGNIHLDRLWSDIPARLAVDVFEYTAPSTITTDLKWQKSLRLLAVRFDYDDIWKRFAALSRTEYFE